MAPARNSALDAALNVENGGMATHLVPFLMILADFDVDVEEVSTSPKRCRRPPGPRHTPKIAIPALRGDQCKLRCSAAPQRTAATGRRPVAPKSRTNDVFVCFLAVLASRRCGRGSPDSLGSILPKPQPQQPGALFGAIFDDVC